MFCPCGLNEFDDEVTRTWQGIFVQSTVTATCTQGLRGGPLALAISLIGLPIIHVALSAASEYVTSLVDKVAQNLSYALQDRLKEIVVEMRKEQAWRADIANTAIIGHSLILDLGTLFLLPAKSGSEFFLAKADHTCIKIDLDNIDNIACSSRNKNLLRLCKFIVTFKRRALLDTPKTALNISVTYLAASKFFRENRSSLIEEGALAIMLLAGAGYTLKWIGRHNNPQLTSALRTASASQVNASQGRVSAPPANNSPGNSNAVANASQLPVEEVVPRLPPEIVSKIMCFLPLEKMNVIARHNGYWRAACYSAQQENLRPLFGDDLTKVLGPWLTMAPWIDLETTLADSLFDSHDHQFFLRQYLVKKENENPALFSAIQTFAGRQNVEDWPMSHTVMIHLSKGKIVAGPAVFSPSVARNDTSANTHLFFIDRHTLKHHKLIKFKDAAGRYGVAFQYVFRCRIEEEDLEVPGVAILHQLKAGQPEYVWIENQSVYQGYDFEGRFVINRSESLVNLLGTRQRYFLFIYNSNLDAKNNHLAWLQKFLSGEACGPLFFGQERLGPPFGSYTFEAKNISTLKLIQQFFAARK